MKIEVLGTACMNCSHQCKEEAINFPPLTVPKDIGKE
jgi:hypothetical protein